MFLGPRMSFLPLKVIDFFKRNVSRALVFKMILLTSVGK